jgi:hypothetical protein
MMMGNSGNGGKGRLMLKLVGTNPDGSVADEKVLVTDDNKPTKLLIGLALLELTTDITLACVLANTLFKKKA